MVSVWEVKRSAISLNSHEMSEFSRIQLLALLPRLTDSLHSFGRPSVFAIKATPWQANAASFRMRITGERGFPTLFFRKQRTGMSVPLLFFLHLVAVGFTPTEIYPKSVSTLRARRFSRQYWIAHIVQYVLNV